MRLTAGLRVAFPLALLLWAGAVAAEEAAPSAPIAFGQPRQGFELNLGAGPLAYPAYPGARTYRTVPFPYLGGGWGERVEFDLLDGLRVTALEAAGFSFGPAARFRFGRRTSDDRAQLRGLRSFGDTGELGGFVAFESGPVYLDLTATQDAGRAHRGAALDGRALLGLPLGPVGVQVGPEVRAVTRAFAEAYYGISPNQATASGRPAYTAHAGLERAGFLAVAEWPMTRHLALRGFVEYGRLLDGAARSPIVGAGGRADQVYAAVFLTWRLF